MKTVWRLCRFCLSLLILSGCVSPGETVDVPDSSVDRARMNARAEAAAAPRLVRLVDERKQITLRPEDYADTALRDITRLTTPAGYRLKYRFLELGVPVAQGLSLSKDPQLQGRLLEVARFESGVKTRAESLLVLAAQKKPEHIKFFREALLDRNVALQFAALEALEAWALPEALPLLLDAANRGWSPLIRAYAAQVAWRRGAPEGKQMLLSFLSDTNWLMRSMAARYLGDWGEGKDAETILSRLGREGDNDFALAEICIAGLKLLARRGPPVPPPPPPRPRPGTPPPAVVSPLFELEPLIVTAPRLKVSGGQLVDPRIDSQLVALLDRLATKVRPDVVVQDPALVEVDQLVTPKGFGLKIRYSDISYLLTEGLAGTTNLTLITRMEDIARRSPDGGVRTAAYVSLGFDPTRVSLSIFQEGLLKERDAWHRFGVVEGLSAQANPMARGILAGVAQTDQSLVVRLFAAQELGRRGDSQGVDILRRSLGDPDWVIRALSTYYLGQLGDDADFERILVNLDRESEDHAVAEDCLAVLRMSR